LTVQEVVVIKLYVQTIQYDIELTYVTCGPQEAPIAVAEGGVVGVPVGVPRGPERRRAVHLECFSRGDAQAAPTTCLG
jgi:hypothetical protein